MVYRVIGGRIFNNAGIQQAYRFHSHRAFSSNSNYCYPRRDYLPNVRAGEGKSKDVGMYIQPATDMEWIGDVQW